MGRGSQGRAAATGARRAALLAAERRGYRSRFAAAGNLIEATGRRCCRAESGAATRRQTSMRFAREIVNAAAHEDLKAAICEPASRFNRKDDGPGQTQNRAPAIKADKSASTKAMLNEMRIAEIGKAVRQDPRGAEVVVTPLARDRAREMKIEIVRQSHEDRDR